MRAGGQTGERVSRIGRAGQDPRIFAHPYRVAWSIKQATTRLSLSDSNFGFGRKHGIQGIQGYFQISIDAPLPTKKHAPFATRLLSLSIAF